ncbi:MAG: S-layer homology domain-containing protein, partial [Lawsonibacter sp.]|nr:S-layer homology domain-containing protein [Lawsonibacter sp.]
MKKRILSIALALTMMAGLSVTALAAAPTFIDVPEDTWYYTWVTKAAQQGWVSGVGDGRFDPEGSVTFAQFALMLDRAL